MKKYIALTLITFLSTVSFANDGFKNIVLVSSENRNMVLEYFGFEDIKTTLTIKNQFDTILYNETEKTPDLLQQEFNLNGEKGDKFIVRIENKYKSIEVTYTFDGQRAIAHGKPIEIFKPLFIKNGKEVLLYLLNSLEKKVIIDIVDEQGNTLVPKIISNKSVIKKLFDFSALSSKARIRVRNGRYFIQEFTF